MRLFPIPRVALLPPLVLTTFIPRQAFGNGDLHQVKNIIIVMQENHSFDNYFWALAYAPGSPYHTRFGGCPKEDHNCVDGLSCKADAAGNLTCFNSNLDDNGSTVFAFHDSRRCAPPDLNHSWFPTHQEANFLNPNGTFAPPGGYKPITGTIFDLLDKGKISWADYFQDAPQGGSFRLFGSTGVDPHFLPLQVFLAQAAGAPGVGPLPQVTFVDPNFGLSGRQLENDEHPPTDIQRGQAFVSQVVNAVRNGPLWQDSVIFITYDEHGGYYDHVAPPKARQGGARMPDGISNAPTYPILLLAFSRAEVRSAHRIHSAS